MEVSYLDLVKHGFLSQFIVHTYFISEKRKLSITNENKKATFEVFAINLVFRGFVQPRPIYVVHSKANFDSEYFHAFQKNRKDFAKPGCPGQFCVSFCFVFFSLASK